MCVLWWEGRGHWVVQCVVVVMAVAVTWPPLHTHGHSQVTFKCMVVTVV